MLKIVLDPIADRLSVILKMIGSVQFRYQYIHTWPMWHRLTVTIPGGSLQPMANNLWAINVHILGLERGCIPKILRRTPTEINPATFGGISWDRRLNLKIPLRRKWKTELILFVSLLGLSDWTNHVPFPRNQPPWLVRVNSFVWCLLI